MGVMTSLETYLNHQVRTQTPNGISSRSNTSSPPQHGLPQALSSSVDNQLKSAGLAVDLNDKGKLHSSFSACFMTCNRHNLFTELLELMNQKIMS